MSLVFGRLNASAGDYGPHAHGNVSASVMPVAPRQALKEAIASITEAETLPWACGP